MNRLLNVLRNTPKHGVISKIINRSFASSSTFNSTSRNIQVHHFHNSINSIYKTEFLSNKLDNYFLNNKNFDNMLNNLNKIEDTNFKKDCYTILNDCKQNLNDFEFKDLNKILLKNEYLIKNSLNENNYYKHTLLSNEVLTSYLILWNKTAQTNIHFHASNGCYVFNLQGVWEETIFQNMNTKKKRQLKAGDINYISNEEGAHQVRFIENSTLNPHLDKVFGISINIYSPTYEL